MIDVASASRRASLQRCAQKSKMPKTLKQSAAAMACCTSCDGPCDSRYLCLSCSQPVHRSFPETILNTLQCSTVFGVYIEGEPCRRLCAACQAGRPLTTDSARATYRSRPRTKEVASRYTGSKAARRHSKTHRK